MIDESMLGAGPPDLREFQELRPPSDADLPVRLEFLADGREVAVTGPEPDALDRWLERQELPGNGAGSLVVGWLSLERLSVEVTMEELVAVAVSEGAEAPGDDLAAPDLPLLSLRDVLADTGVVVSAERAYSLEDLAAEIESGRGVVLAGDAGCLFDDPARFSGGANTTVLVMAVARDLASSELVAFDVLTVGDKPQVNRVPATALVQGWLSIGSLYLVLEQPGTRAAGKPTGGSGGVAGDRGAGGNGGDRGDVRSSPDR